MTPQGGTRKPSATDAGKTAKPAEPRTLMQAHKALVRIRPKGNASPEQWRTPMGFGERVAMNEIFPSPRVFWWLPVAGQRHAIRECDRTAPTGAPVHTLCAQMYDRPAPPTDVEWFWRTCQLCWEEACKIVDG